MNLNDSTEGRWMTPDPLGGDITNPQSLNRYAYALNNPATLTDPSGMGPSLGDDWCPPESGQCFTPPGYVPPDSPTAISGSPTGVATGSMIGSMSSDMAAAYANYASNFGWLVQGSLYGHTIQPTFFSSLDAYFNWRTRLAVLPQNEAYGLFSTAANQQSLDPGKAYTVNAYYQGLEMNIQVGDVGLNTSLLPPGSVQDPFTFTHHGNTSYIQLWSPFDSSHYVDAFRGFQFHQDVFGPLLPLHYIDWGAGAILGQSPGMSFTCQMNVGCH